MFIITTTIATTLMCSITATTATSLDYNLPIARLLGLDSLSTVSSQVSGVDIYCTVYIYIYIYIYMYYISVYISQCERVVT